MKKFKTFYLILLFVITAIVIIFIVYGKVGKLDFAAFRKSEMKKEIVQVQEFKDIKIDASLIALEIKRADEYKIEYNYPTYITPKCEVEGDELKVSIKGKANNGFTLFGIRFLNGDVFNKDIKFTIYVPEDATLGELVADVDAGSIKLDSFTFDKLEIQADAANVELDNVVSAVTTLSADAGNIGADNCDLGALDVETDAGNVEIRKVTAGDVTIKTDMGNISIKNTVFNDGLFNSSLGNVSIQGDFASITADCSLGAVSVDSDNLDKAKLDLTVDLGSLRVGGKNIRGTKYRQ